MSVLIGRHVMAKCGGILAGGMYPCVATKGALTFPFGVYGVEGMDADYTKDGSLYDSVKVMVMVAGKTYEDVTDGAYAVRRALEGVTGVYDRFEVTDCELNGMKDGYDEQSELYTFELKFIFTTLNFE